MLYGNNRDQHIGICSNCIHRPVCKNVEEVTSAEIKFMAKGTTAEAKPYFTINCGYRDTWEDIEKRYGC